MKEYKHGEWILIRTGDVLQNQYLRDCIVEIAEGAKDYAIRNCSFWGCEAINWPDNSFPKCVDVVIPMHEPEVVTIMTSTIRKNK